MGNVSKKKRQINGFKTSKWSIDIRQDEHPQIGRIVLADSWYPCPEDHPHPKAIELISKDAKTVLRAVCMNFPKTIKVKYLLTCGGFIHFPWPEISTDFDFINPPESIIKILTDLAEAACEGIIDNNLKNSLAKITRFITLGVDSYRDGLYSGKGPHIELIGVLDLQKNKYCWTGKSYPTTGQAKNLIRANAQSHFIRLNGERVMLLGCHDFNLFSPRSRATAGRERQGIIRDFEKQMNKNLPTTVLQHPHTSDTYRVWLLPYSNLLKLYPSIQRFASAGRYENPKGDIPRAEEYGGCRAVLEKLKKGPTLDLILSR